MRVTLFHAFPDPWRQSMAVYATELGAALREVMAADETVVACHPAPVRLSGPGRWWDQYVGYPRRARRQRSDVNHVVDHAYAHLCRALGPRRTVITFHDAIGLGDAGEPRGLLRRLVGRWNARALGRAAAVICVSEWSRGRLLARCPVDPDRVVVIPEGVAAAFFAAPPGDARARLGLGPGRYVLHVGHTRRYKNLPAVLRVLAHLVRATSEEVQLLKVGEALTPEQRRLARDLGVEDRILHLGLVPRERLPDVYRAADLLLFPSWEEGFGLPVLEAMAAGVPVVAADRGALPEVAGEAALLADPADADALALAAFALLEDPGLARKLGEAGRARAAAFTWRRAAAATLAVYRRVRREAEP